MIIESTFYIRSANSQLDQRCNFKKIGKNGKRVVDDDDFVKIKCKKECDNKHLDRDVDPRGTLKCCRCVI